MLPDYKFGKITMVIRVLIENRNVVERILSQYPNYYDVRLKDIISEAGFTVE